MLQQMSEATLTLLLTMLALGAVIRFMPAAGRGRRGKKARSVAVWAGIGLGMVSSLALTIINVEAPKSVNRQTVGLFTLPVAIVLAVLFLALIAVRSRRVRSLLPGDADDEARAASSMETAVSGDTLVRIVGALYIAAALFQPVPLLLVAATWYLAITSVLMIGQHYLEKYFERGATRQLTGRQLASLADAEGTIPSNVEIIQAPASQRKGR